MKKFEIAFSRYCVSQIFMALVLWCFCGGEAHHLPWTASYYWAVKKEYLSVHIFHLAQHLAGQNILRWHCLEHS